MQHWKRQRMGLFVKLTASMAFGLGLYAIGVATLTVALSVITFSIAVMWVREAEKKPEAPGPSPWPVLGSLHLMDGFRVRPVILFIFSALQDFSFVICALQVFNEPSKT